MTDYSVLGNLLFIYTVSIAVVFLFHQFRLPSIAGFLVAGALIGPHGLNLISDIATVQVLAEIGIVLLLFTIGIEFSLRATDLASSAALDCGANPGRRGHCDRMARRHAGRITDTLRRSFGVFCFRSAAPRLC